MRDRTDPEGLLAEVVTVATAVVGLAIVATLTRKEAEAELARPVDEDAAADSWARRFIQQGADLAFIEEARQRTDRRRRTIEREAILADQRRRRELAREERERERIAARARAREERREEEAQFYADLEAALAHRINPAYSDYIKRARPWALQPGGDILPAREPLHVRDVIAAILEAREASE